MAIRPSICFLEMTGAIANTRQIQNNNKIDYKLYYRLLGNLYKTVDKRLVDSQCN